MDRVLRVRHPELLPSPDEEHASYTLILWHSPVRLALGTVRSLTRGERLCSLAPFEQPT